MEKERIRREIIARRQGISDRVKHEADTRIATKLLSRPDVRAGTAICCYVSLPEEVDTHGVIFKLLQDGKIVVVPRLENQVLSLYAIESFDELMPGAFGVLEPKTTYQRVNASVIDVFIVPGIAFDRRGHRLGWGKGYYDQLLAGVAARKIGFAYDYQIVPRLPHHGYDIQMNTVITEKEVYEE